MHEVNGNYKAIHDEFFMHTGNDGHGNYNIWWKFEKSNLGVI